MTLIETKPDEGQAAAAFPARGAPALLPPPPRPGLASFVGTSDHKVVGRLYIGCSLLTIAGGLVLAVLAGAEGIKANGFDILDVDTYFQVFTLSHVALVFLGLIPGFLGLATYLVPLQVGAPTIAFPRAAAGAFWAWLCGAGLLVAGWAINGGPAGGSLEGVLLSVAAWILVLLALVIGWICVVTTVAAVRAPGMTLLQVPAFAWSSLVAGSIWLLTLPLLAANLLLIYVDTDHAQVSFGVPQNVWPQLRWAFAQPAVFTLAIPVLGFAADAVAGLARRRQGVYPAVLAAIGLFGALTFGGWAQTAFNVELMNQALFVIVSLAMGLPLLALLGGLGDTLRRGRPTAASPLPLGLIGLLAVLAAAGAGGLGSLPVFDLAGTLWNDGVAKLVVGATITGLVGALHYWGAKLWGSPPVEALGKLNVLVLLGGTALFGGCDLVAGGLGQLAATPTGDQETVKNGAEALAAGSALGAALLLGGVLLAILATLPAALRRSGAADADTWGHGQTLEWSVASPPPHGNFVALGPVTSHAPLLDAREAAGIGSEVS